MNKRAQSNSIPPVLPPVPSMIEGSPSSANRHDSAVSTSSQYIDYRFGLSSRPTSSVSNFSRPTSVAPSLHPQSSSKPQKDLPPIPPPPSASPIENPTTYDKTTKQHRRQGRLPSAPTHPASPTATHRRTSRDSFDLHIVPTAHPFLHRGTNIHSIALSHHDISTSTADPSLCSSRITHIPQHPDLNFFPPPSPHTSISSSTLIPAPLKPRSPPPLSHHHRTHSSSHTVHPSSLLLLSSPSPHVRILLTTRRGLLTTLESATLPLTSPTSPPIPWYHSWPTTAPLPITHRTLAVLRTTNIVRPEPINPDDHDDVVVEVGGDSGGQGTHFSRLTPFRFCLQTRVHGPKTDFSHPSFAGSVAAGRALWCAMYRDVNYRGLDGREVRVVSRVSTGVERRRCEAEGWWLRRGGLRGVMAEEGILGGSGARSVREGRHRREWSEASMGSLRRVGTSVERGWGLLRGGRKNGQKKMDKRVPKPQDASGWYSDSDD